MSATATAGPSNRDSRLGARRAGAAKLFKERRNRTYDMMFRGRSNGPWAAEPVISAGLLGDHREGWAGPGARALRGICRGKSKGYDAMAYKQLNQLLTILAVAGIFISLTVTAVFLVFAIAGALGGEEPANVWVIVWNSFFIGLPLYGILYAALRLRESMRAVLGEMQKQSR